MTSPEKETFYSSLNMEDITEADYEHWKRVCKEFEIKKLGISMTCILKVIHCC